jgi:predicted transcriptional regulator
MAKIIVRYMQRLQFETKLIFEDIFSSKSKCKILKLLAKENELNISKIATQTNINHIIVKRNLEFFSQIGFVQEKIFGRIKIYRFRDENLKARAFKHLIEFWESDTEDEL